MTENSTFMKFVDWEHGWKSLVSTTEKNEKDVITELFSDYATRLEDPLFMALREKRAFSSGTIGIQRHYRWIMRSVISDLFLKYLILSSDENEKVRRSSLGKVVELEDFVNFLDGETSQRKKESRIVKEIKKIVNTQFNPYWKFTQSIASYHIQKKMKLIEKLKQNKFKRDLERNESRRLLEKEKDNKILNRMDRQDALDKMQRAGTLDPKKHDKKVNRIKREAASDQEEFSRALIQINLDAAKDQEEHEAALNKIKIDKDLEWITSRVGDQLLNCWDKYAILRYRSIYQLNIKRAEQKCKNDKKKLLESYNEECLLSLNILSSSSFEFQLEPYLFSLLNHHEPLIKQVPQMMGLFYRGNSEENLRSSVRIDRRSKNKSTLGLLPQSSKKSTSKENQEIEAGYTAEILLNELLSSTPQKAIRCLDRYRWFAESYFPDPKRKQEAPSCKSISYSTTHDAREETNEKRIHRFGLLFAKQISKTPFSYRHLEFTVPKIVKILGEEYSNEKLILRFSKMAQAFFKLSLEPHVFGKLLSSCLEPMNQLVEKKFPEDSRQISKQIIENIWDKLYGWFDKKDESALITDLNRLCVQFYRQLEPTDLNKHLAKFLMEIHDPNIVDETISKMPLESEMKTTEQEKKVMELSSHLPTLFDYLCYLITYKILTAKNAHEAKIAVKNCIHLAELSLKPPILNMFLCNAIYTAFISSPIQWLGKSIYLDQMDEFQKFQTKMGKLFSPISNYRNYKEFVNSSKYPVIPNITITYRDMTFATEAEVTKEQCKLIKEMVNQFERTQILLKLAVPLKWPMTDGNETIEAFPEILKSKNKNKSFENKDVIQTTLYRLAQKRWPIKK